MRKGLNSVARSQTLFPPFKKQTPEHSLARILSAIAIFVSYSWVSQTIYTIEGMASPLLLNPRGETPIPREVFSQCERDICSRSFWPALLFRREWRGTRSHPLDCEAHERNLGVRKKKQAHEHESASTQDFRLRFKPQSTQESVQEQEKQQQKREIV